MGEGDPIRRPGDQLQFISQGDHQSVYHLNQPIAWQNNQWYQVTITYDSFTSQLYINGEATASGPGITAYPRDDLATLTGIRIGGGLAGSFSLDAVIDNLETFNYPLDETEIQENYLAVSPDHDGDGIISFEEEFLHLDPLNPDTDYDGVSDGQELEEGTKPFLSFDGLPRKLASFPFEDGTLTGNRRQLPRLIGQPKQPMGWKGYGFHFQKTGSRHSPTWIPRRMDWPTSTSGAERSSAGSNPTGRAVRDRTKSYP